VIHGGDKNAITGFVGGRVCPDRAFSAEFPPFCAVQVQSVNIVIGVDGIDSIIGIKGLATK
jgi:hypothetical protein